VIGKILRKGSLQQGLIAGVPEFKEGGFRSRRGGVSQTVEAAVRPSTLTPPAECSGA